MFCPAEYLAAASPDGERQSAWSSIFEKERKGKQSQRDRARSSGCNVPADDYAALLGETDQDARNMQAAGKPKTADQSLHREGQDRHKAWRPNAWLGRPAAWICSSLAARTVRLRVARSSKAWSFNLPTDELWVDTLCWHFPTLTSRHFDSASR